MKGLSGQIFTQISDIECEQSGFFTYDRRVTKVDLKAIGDSNRELLANASKLGIHPPPPPPPSGSAFGLEADSDAKVAEGYPCLNATNPSFKCTAKCICGAPPKFKKHDIQSKDNVTYSPKYGLELHVFEPPASDTRAKRPAMVMIHGGGFKNGNKDDKAGIIGWSKQLAMRGFVCVSIDYRINVTQSKEDPEESQLWAAYDANAAVRWLRTNAKEMRIDTDRIGAFGSSAGAMTVAFMSTVGMGDNDDNAGVSSDIRAGVSLSGALECIGANAAYCDLVPNVTAAHPPFLDFHGCNDGTVPYGPCSAAPKPENCWGSGVDTNKALLKAGVAAYLFSFPGKGHVPWGNLAAEPAAGMMVDFLAENLDLAHAECP